MCALTLPTIRAWARKINAQLNIISERRFPDYPVPYEYSQISTLGRDFDWNISLDVDILMHNQVPDPRERLAPESVGIWAGYDLRHTFADGRTNPIFVRDGRYSGIGGCFVVTSRKTHKLWNRLSGNFDKYRNLCKPHLFWEYNISLNAAKHGYPITLVFSAQNEPFHLNTTSNSVSDPAGIARQTLAEWERVGRLL